MKDKILVSPTKVLQEAGETVIYKIYLQDGEYVELEIECVYPWPLDKLMEITKRNSLLEDEHANS